MCSHWFWTGSNCFVVNRQGVSQQFSHPCTIKSRCFPALHNPTQFISLLLLKQMLCYQVLFKCSSSTLFSPSLPQKDGEKKHLPLPWRSVMWCLPMLPWEARSLKPITSMSMSEVLHELFLNLESIQEMMIWRAGIWHKDNEREQSWHEEIPSKQRLFISESRGTHRVNGKLSQIPTLEVWGQPLLILLM